MPTPTLGSSEMSSHLQNHPQGWLRPLLSLYHSSVFPLLRPTFVPCHSQVLTLRALPKSTLHADLHLWVCLPENPICDRGLSCWLKGSWVVSWCSCHLTGLSTPNQVLYLAKKPLVPVFALSQSSSLSVHWLRASWTKILGLLWFFQSKPLLPGIRRPQINQTEMPKLLDKVSLRHSPSCSTLEILPSAPSHMRLVLKRCLGSSSNVFS